MFVRLALERQWLYTKTMTVNVELIHDRAINLLSEMERLNLIRLNILAKNTSGTTGKLSGQFAGALELSDSKYDAFQNTLREGREEWTQNIC